MPCTSNIIPIYAHSDVTTIRQCRAPGMNIGTMKKSELYLDKVELESMAHNRLLAPACLAWLEAKLLSNAFGCCKE